MVFLKNHTACTPNLKGDMCNCKSAFIPGGCGHRGDARRGGGGGGSDRGARGRFPLHLRLASVGAGGDAGGGGGGVRGVRRQSMRSGPEV